MFYYGRAELVIFADVNYRFFIYDNYDGNNPKIQSVK